MEFVEVSPDFFSNGKHCACSREIIFIGNVNPLPTPTPKRTIRPGTNFTYIDKNFTFDVGTSQIIAGESQFNVYQISGCRFTDIQATDRNHLIRALSEIVFFDNVFENTELPSSTSVGIMWCNYNGKMTISNCKFIRILGRVIEGCLILAINNIIDLTLEKCEFIDCGREYYNLPLISLYNGQSTASFYGCNFTFSNSLQSYRILEIGSHKAIFDHCRFVKCGGNTINKSNYLSEDSIGDDTIRIFQFTNNYVTSNNGNFINATKMRNKPNISNNTFEKITINNNFLIYISHNLEQIELINNSFSNIIISDTNKMSGGGIATLIGYSEFTIQYEKCKFYDIINDNDIMPYYQGGAISYGFSNININAHIRIIQCEFKRNKAKHHGGAIFIQTSKTVFISDCGFESNIANNDKKESMLLFENYYERKDKGFGGAIFLNPSFNFNGEDYCMSHVTISHCLFKNNQAYQGFDIYIEGDYCDTSFIINDNEFINDYKNENITKGSGIIASEIFAISKNEIENSNDFSKSEIGTTNIENFILVDHSGNRIPDSTSTPEITQIQYEGDIIDISRYDKTYHIRFNCPVHEGSIKFYAYCLTCNKINTTDRPWFKIYFKKGNIENVEYEDIIIHNTVKMATFVPRDKISYDEENSMLSVFVDSIYMRLDQTMIEKDLKCLVPPITIIATPNPSESLPLPSISQSPFPSVSPLPTPDQSVTFNPEGLINLTCDKFSYEGEWQICVQSYYADVGSYTFAAGSKARINFVGVKIHLFTIKESVSGWVNIRIDDEIVGTINLFSEYKCESIVFTSNDLPYGEHVFEIE